METLAEKCGLCTEIIENFKGNSLIFILKKRNRKKIKFEKDGKEWKVILKGPRLIKGYFKFTGEKSSSYYIWKERLYINMNQLNNYVTQINGMKH